MKKFELQIVLLLALVIMLLLALVVPASAAPIVPDAQPPAPIDWSKVLSDAVRAALLVAIPLVVKWLRDWFKAQAEAALAQIESYSPDLMGVLREAASIAVQAAEQYKLTDKLLDKKKYAVDIARQWLAARGVKIDVSLIEAAIEAQVGIFYPHKNQPMDTGCSPAEYSQR